MEHAEEPGRRGIAGECPFDFAQGRSAPRRASPEGAGDFSPSGSAVWGSKRIARREGEPRAAEKQILTAKRFGMTSATASGPRMRLLQSSHRIPKLP